MKEQMLVSIVVPVYNVEEYLRQCVDSLIVQTYQNLEIILVDDGSTDNSPAICDEYALNDKRVVVIHQENQGQGAARVNAIAQAKGEYVMTVDGDDWLDDRTVERCVQAVVENEDVECVLFPYVREFPSKSIPAHLFDSDQTFIGNEAKKVYRRLFGLVGEELAYPERLENLASCCMKLYKTELARKGKLFDLKRIGSSEDTLFNMYALVDCKAYAYIDEPFYHYRKTETSCTYTYRPNLVEQWSVLFDEMQTVIDLYGLDETFEEALQNRIALSSAAIGRNVYFDEKQTFFGGAKEIKIYLKSERYRLAIKRLPLSKLPLKWRAFCFCCKYKFSFLVALMIKFMEKMKDKSNG